MVISGYEFNIHSRQVFVNKNFNCFFLPNDIK